MNYKTKTTAALALIISLVSLFLCCIPSYAAPALAKDRAYFDYNDGIVRDGARNDAPGIIGDELDHLERSAEAENISRNANQNRSNNGFMTFWGIVLALLVAASVILIIALSTPKSMDKRKR